ncbi:hypothetical protein N7476_002308 [Penicillium atrosanguineum]|uniref:DHHA2 domain-containing protein n=1 Tax=Penicillium atrosanguineum TaxID=1132637 RepID=A0A9W9Q4Y5_9EURO|nr:hypothetical protein N7526_005850 [Penicillium atrosanguineum]KAJ5323708.1 hypothetical protein N7476_002308 [Penicillium atrosanguineum]
MTLLQFLRQARQIHLQFLAGALSEPPIYVVGNPSADLDSIISAIVYSYWASNRLPSTTPRPHIPLLNLPTVPAGSELYRLRPEFVTTLWLSTTFPALNPDSRFENSSDSAGKLLREHIVTVADFAQRLRGNAISKQLFADATLVDWNAMPHRVEGQKGHGSVAGLSEVSFRTVGCVDHHVDEHFVPSQDALPENQPLIIQTGPGSCSSLIANELVRRGLWAADASSAENAQLAKLALAAILIDTSNLTAEGKVTDVDIQAVSFLREQVAKEDPKWHAEAFYEQVQAAKTNSLDLLTLDEVLDRDYKEWTEKSSSGESVNLGFCSSVKPIRWIAEKAGTPQQFLDGVRAFAAAKKLDVVVIMTSFSSVEDEFSRELLVCAMCDCDAAVKAAEAFVEQTRPHLGLERWSPVDCEYHDSTEHAIRSTLDGDADIWRRLWLQTNTTASRKQVAPLLRKAVTSL